MQYLLTEEEYKILHGEGDKEMDELEINIIHLQRDIREFTTNLHNINLVAKGDKPMLKLEIFIDSIPKSILIALQKTYPALR